MPQEMCLLKTYKSFIGNMEGHIQRLVLKEEVFSPGVVAWSCPCISSHFWVISSSFRQARGSPSRRNVRRSFGSSFCAESRSRRYCGSNTSTNFKSVKVQSYIFNCIFKNTTVLYKCFFLVNIKLTANCIYVVGGFTLKRLNSTLGWIVSDNTFNILRIKQHNFAKP